MDKFIATLISCTASGLFGYVVSFVTNKNKRNKAHELALLTLLQNSLTNVYFTYENINKIPDYIYKNWLNLLHAYEALGGDDYIHALAERMRTWDIEKTDILK